MTENQKRFADEYLIDLNATRAYKGVYKNCKKDETAAAAGARLLKNVKVSGYIKERLDEMASERIADATEVMEYLTSVMRGKSLSSVLSMCGDGCQEIVEKEPDEKEKLKAAELLGKRFGMFKDNVDITSNGKTVIVDDIDEG